MDAMTTKKARDAYRAAWCQWCLARTREQQIEAERAMDAVQADCTLARRPGPEWEAFIATLPGYREHWAGLAAECEDMTADLEKRK